MTIAAEIARHIEVDPRVPIEDAWTRLREVRQLSEADAWRQVLRTMLRAAGIAERVVADDGGGRRLQARGPDGAWLDLDPLLLVQARDDEVPPAF